MRALVLRALERGENVRPVGAGHSSSPLVATQHALVSLKHFAQLEAFDRERCTATIGTGMTLEQAGEAIFRVGLAMPNLGDIDEQTVAGAIATGTHGSGHALQNLATMLIGGRLVDGHGRSVDIDFQSEPEVLRAARCSLGLHTAHANYCGCRPIPRGVVALMEARSKARPTSRSTRSRAKTRAPR